MTNDQKLERAFIDGLQLPPGIYSDELRYETIPQWDSTGHMALIVEIEKQFDVMLGMEDIIDMSSVAKTKQILARHHIQF